MAAQVRHITGGIERVHTGYCPNGHVQVTDTYTSVVAGGETVGWSLSRRDLTLDGERVFWPRNAELACAAGIEDAPPFIDVDGQPLQGNW